MKFLTAWSEKAQRNGPVFNTLDAMKFFAIVTMTVDHLGMYLFPDAVWLRAIGRVPVPVWFFLAGFARGPGIGRGLWLYAAILTLAQPFVFHPVFPINVLATIILCRLALNLTDRLGWTMKYPLELGAAAFFLSFFTYPVFEYGSVVFMYALIGRLAREKDRPKHYTGLVVLAYLTFLAWQWASYDFNAWQLAYVGIGTALTVKWLARSSIRPLIADWTANRWTRALAVLSRNTLPYYFYHRLLLQLLAAWLVASPDTPAFRWFK